MAPPPRVTPASGRPGHRSPAAEGPTKGESCRSLSQRSASTTSSLGVVVAQRCVSQGACGRARPPRPADGGSPLSCEVAAQTKPSGRRAAFASSDQIHRGGSKEAISPNRDDISPMTRLMTRLIDFSDIILTPSSPPFVSPALSRSHHRPGGTHRRADADPRRSASPPPRATKRARLGTSPALLSRSRRARTSTPLCGARVSPPSWTSHPSVRGTSRGRHARGAATPPQPSGGRRRAARALGAST